MSIDVVVVSYNSARFLPDCLDSLARQHLPCGRIIVVDNASGDGSAEWLRGRPEITAVLLERNIGYAAAANLGITHSSGEVVVVANSDTRFAADFTRVLQERFREDDRLALVSPLILRFDGETIDSAGQAMSAAVYPREIGYGRPRRQLELREGPVFSVCGAATVFARWALERLKTGTEYYDEDFFMFWEDFDMGWRAQRLGLSCRFLPEAVVYHHRSGTLEKGFLARFSLALARPAEIKYHLIKNRYLTLIKNFSWRRDFLRLPLILLRDPLWVGALTITAPNVIIRLAGAGKYIRRAWRKRRLTAGRHE